MFIQINFGWPKIVLIIFQNLVFVFFRILRFIRTYCLFQRFWRSGLSSYCVARGGPNLLKFLYDNLTLIYVRFLVIGKIFRPPTSFWARSKGKMERFFLNIFKMVNLNEIFYVMKVVGKIQLGISFIGRIVNFHFRPILEFSDSRFWSY
jgi:hypothetical protein